MSFQIYLFPTIAFTIFFSIVFAIYWSLPEKSTFRKLALLAASVFFYGCWNWSFALMMLASAAINHDAATLIDRSSDVRKRKSILIWTIAINLAALAFFKYTSFIVSQCLHPLALPIAEHFGVSEQYYEYLEDRVFPFTSEIVLPVGISFYTFMAISYVVDVFKGKMKPATSLLDFANYLSFFPKLAAGPIARASDLLPQMENLPSRDTSINTGRAATLILGGLFKKMVVANWLSENLVNNFFSNPDKFGTVDAFLGVYGYAIQIYCDFSAYSDIATGCALLLGFTFPENFRAPYFATSFQDFWRRWHISLSSWLRDYLYIPLGGSRCANWKIYRNLMLTMLLGGLWHGAGWVFIIWGAIHGLVQVIERPFNKKKPKEAVAAAPIFDSKYIAFLRGLITFNIIAFAWIFFRAGSNDVEGLTTVKNIFSAFTRATTPTTLFSLTAIVMLVLGFALQLLDGDTPKRVWAFFNKLHPVLQGVIVALLLTVIAGLGPAGVPTFIYFQF